MSARVHNGGLAGAHLRINVIEEGPARHANAQSREECVSITRGGVGVRSRMGADTQVELEARRGASGSRLPSRARLGVHTVRGHREE